MLHHYHLQEQHIWYELSILGKLICFCSMNQFLKWFYLFLHYSKIGACKQENLAKWHSKNIFCTHSGWSILFTCLIWINCLCASCFENVHTCINTMKKNAVSLHCWDFGVTPFITICLNWRFDLFSISKSVVLFMSYLGSKVPRWKRQLSTYLVT